jgi:signal transduction histidine kinase
MSRTLPTSEHRLAIMPGEVTRGRRHRESTFGPESMLAWARRILEHRIVLDLLLPAIVAAGSLAGLAGQHRLGLRSTVLCAALCLPLVARRRWPGPVLAVLSAVAFIQWLLSVPQFADAALLLALYEVSLTRGPLEAGLGVAVLELGAILASVQWAVKDPVKIWVGLTGLVGVSGVIGVSIRQRRALLASLHERAARLEFERDQEGRLGAAAERARIAREMHDIIAHNLSVMIALADGASFAAASAPDRAAEAAARASATGREALVEMRRLLGVLGQPSPESSFAPQPGVAELGTLFARVRVAGIAVQAEIDPHALTLGEGMQLTLFRVAQEALTNVLKHAERPTHTVVTLRAAGTVELEVRDEPIAGVLAPMRLAAADAPTAGRGRGLQGMRDRAAAYDGDLQAGPLPGGGWRVHLRLAGGSG